MKEAAHCSSHKEHVIFCVTASEMADQSLKDRTLDYAQGLRGAVPYGIGMLTVKGERTVKKLTWPETRSIIALELRVLQ